jgi:guanylate kinase
VKKETVYKHISETMPNAIYLTGKTCTGKSTFTKYLVDKLHYEHIELDKVVRQQIIYKLNLKDEGSVFQEVYKYRNEMEWITLFVQSVKQILNAKEKEGKKVVIEGALANTKTLKEIFDDLDSFLFVYFHPYELENYTSYLTMRFLTSNETNEASLPKSFWSLIDQNNFKKFCKTREISNELKESINKYAQRSKVNSEKRLISF